MFFIHAFNKAPDNATEVGNNIGTFDDYKYKSSSQFANKGQCVSNGVVSQLTLCTNREISFTYIRESPVYVDGVQVEF